MPDKAQPAYRVEALEKRHDRGGFSCGTQALDRYLHHQARQDADKRVAAPFALVEPPSNRVLGYHTLSASVIHANDLPEELSSAAAQIAAMAVVVDAKDKAAEAFYAISWHLAGLSLADELFGIGL